MRSGVNNMTTQQALTQLIQRQGECEFWPRQSPDIHTLTITDAIGRVSSDRPVASGTVASISSTSIQFSIAKTSGNQIVGNIREDFDTVNLNESIEFNSLISGVQPFDSCAFPTDGTLGSFSGQEFVVKTVNTLEDPGNASNFLNEIILYDSIGGEVSPPAALVGLSVSFSDKTKVHPENYNLFRVEQTGDPNEGDWTLVTRPTADDDTDEYSVDPVAGTVTLNASHIASRPSTGVYCYVLEFDRFDRVNEVKKTDLEEIRLFCEGAEWAKYPVTITSQNLNAERQIHNFWNSKIDPGDNTAVIHDPPSDWWYVAEPLCSANTNAITDFGFNVATTPVGIGGPFGAEYGVAMSVKIPILVFTDQRLLNVPSDWTVLEAKLRYKATRLTGIKEIDLTQDEFGQGITTTTDPWNPNFSAGRCFRPDPTNNWCANLKWNTDDPDAEPVCALRENMNLFSGNFNVDWTEEWFGPGGGVSAQKCGGPNMEQTGAPPVELIDMHYDLSGPPDAWIQNCRYGPPSATNPSDRIRAPKPGLEDYHSGGGGVKTRRTQALTQSLYFRDICQEKTGDVTPHSGNSGTLVCPFQQFLPFSMPEKNSGDGGVNASGNWEELDVTDTIVEVHAEKNSLPGSVGIAFGPLDIIDWNVDALLTGNLLVATLSTRSPSVDETNPPLNAPAAWTIRFFFAEEKEFTFSLEVGELLVKWNAPVGFQTPLASHMNLPGLTKL